MRKLDLLGPVIWVYHLYLLLSGILMILGIDIDLRDFIIGMVLE